MTEQDTAEAVAVAAEPPAKKEKSKARNKAKEKEKAKAKAKVKVKPPRDTAEKSAKADDAFDFVGKVDSLSVRSGAGPEGFAFSLRGRHGKRRTFRFDPADAFAMNAMAHMVLAAHSGGAKLGVRTGAEVDGVLIVRDLETRHKLGK